MSPATEVPAPYTARRAQIDDVAELVSLMEEFYAESDYTLDRKWAERSFNTLIGDPSLGSAWLVLRGDAVVGHAVLTTRFSMEYGGMDAFIGDLFVRPDYRRQGAGTAALQRVLAECRERGVLALHVEAGQDNAAANELYSRFGLALGNDRRYTRTLVFSAPEPSA